MKLIPPNITPGPWHRNIPPASQYPTVFAGRSTHVLHVTAHNQDVEANIQAVIALPQCLEALANCFESLGVAFEFDADVFGVHHNAATDALSEAKAALLAAGYKIEE